MQDELQKLNLKKREKGSLPLGFSDIFIKKIPPGEIENKLLFYSEKYRKVDFVSMSSHKPISKILTLK